MVRLAYAEGWDEKTGRYQALRAGQQLSSVDPEGPGLVVKADVARRQMDAEAPTDAAVQPAGSGPKKGDGTGPTAAAPQIRRFRGRVALNPVRAGTEAGRVADEVISHLAGLANAEVTVTLEISADLPDGASDHVVRTVTENCRTLRFESQGFERE